MTAVNLKSSVILVVDMQNDFVSSRGKFAKSGFKVSHVQKLVPKIEILLRVARQKKIKIMFVKAVYDRKYLTDNVYERYTKLGIKNPLKEGKWGSEFYGLTPQREDLVFTKHRYDLFTNPKFEKWLKQNKITTLILTGYASDVCVDSIARTGFMKGYKIVAVEDCLASAEDKARDMRFYRRQYTAQVLNSRSLFNRK
jgi:ureidoacrylate peracid hydrolase